MIRAEIVFDKDAPEGFSIKRLVAMSGEESDIICDLHAIGYGIAKKIKKLAKDPKQEATLRFKYENAFFEGLRMTEEEIEAVDKKHFDSVTESIVDGLEKEWVKGMKS